MTFVAGGFGYAAEENMKWRLSLALFATLICPQASSILHAGQAVFAFDVGTAPKSETSLRQDVHIFVDSQRQAVSSLEVETPPFNAILKLRRTASRTGKVSECTAFAVDQSIIVTAAHCIHPVDEDPEKPSISVIQGLSAVAVNISPADAKQIKRSNASVSYDGWKDTRSHYDCAVLKLDTSLPSAVVPFQLDESGAICSRASHLETAGYTGPVLRGDPAGIRNLQSYDPDCHDRSADFPLSLERIGQNKMIVDCSGDRGASGSPIYCENMGEHYVVGIFSGENAPLHMEAVPFGVAWNFAERIGSCAKEVRILKESSRRAAR